MQHAVLDLLCAALIPELGADITAGAAGNVQLVLVAVEMCIRDNILAGTLCEVGAGRMQPEQIPGILAGGDRSQAGPTLPAKGLFLSLIHISERSRAGHFQDRRDLARGRDHQAGPARHGRQEVNNAERNRAVPVSYTHLLPRVRSRPLKKSWLPAPLPD